MTWNNFPHGQGFAQLKPTPNELRWVGIILLTLAGLILLRRGFIVAHRVVPLPLAGHDYMCPPRVLTYCVTTWSRDDPWNSRSRWAIGQAARTWNAHSRFRFKEIWCNSPHRIPIFFVAREAHDAWHANDPYGNALAHTTFPSLGDQWVHVNDSLEWMQASDTIGRGYDLESVMLHEFGHNLGLEHAFDVVGSLMHPYEGRHLPGQGDDDTLRTIENRCVPEGEHDPIEVLSPGPGETWRQGATGRANWRSELSEPLRVAIFREDGIAWILAENAGASGTLDITTNTGWPLGAGYQVCVGTADWSTMGCSDMFLVSPP